MGNSVSGLPYDETKEVEGYISSWKMSTGAKKSEEKEPVCIFQFDKAALKDKLPLAQRHFQKIRTVKHPDILSCIESVDLEAALVLVTEPCIPLSNWLSGQDGVDNLEQEIMWGIRCILGALHFMHTTCSLGHGFLDLNAIFVTPSGDWKLGNFDLACNIKLPDDESFFKRYNSILMKPFTSPERSNLGYGEVPFHKAFGVIDMYSLGQCVNAIFNRLRVSVPPQMDKYLTRMLSEEYLRRPSAKQLINSPLFNSDYIKLMSSMVDIAMKPPAETLVILESVQNTHAQIPAFLCVQKVLPTIRAVLQICIRDFQLRDSREICRNTIHVSLNLLSTLVEEKKINEEEFAKTGLTQVLQLWSMADRSVRTSLLRSLKSLLVVIESNYVNKHIFDPMLAGFADSNAVMREDTLKNLVHVVDKLDGKLMQDKLVRSIVNLQNDSEASLRTNATIFLGKIALKLEESARNRIVYPAFIKAMKDQFLHCRIAGIKSTVVCLHSIDLGFLLNKMLPQICLLSVDPSADVREIAIGVIRDSAELLKENHARMKIIEKANREKHAANSIKMKNENSPRPSGDNTPQPMPNNSVAATAASGASAWIQSLVVPELDKSPEIDDTEQKIGELRSKSNTNQNQGIKLSNNNVSPKTSGAVIQQNNDGWDDLDIESEDEIYVKPNSNDGLSNAMMQSKISARKNSWDGFDGFDADFGGKRIKETNAGAQKIKVVPESSPTKKFASKPSTIGSTTTGAGGESVKKTTGLGLVASRGSGIEKAEKEKEKKGGSLKIKGAKMAATDVDWDDF